MKEYAIKTCSDTNELRQELYQAVCSCDISGLLQVFSEGLDLMTTLPMEVILTTTYYYLQLRLIFRHCDVIGFTCRTYIYTIHV